MKYTSTRGEAPELGFNDVLLTGLAMDGGLYVPVEWPQLSAETIRDFANQPYAEIAKQVLAPFVEGEIPNTEFNRMIDEAYATFNHPAVTPLVQYDHNHWILELFHGPTLAFKDVAMQLLSRMMDYVLTQRNQRATIVGATSGDTGSAAIEAFRGRENTDIFILFPKGKVSPVQQRQMTTVHDENVHPIAIEGDFDDCQALIKSLFNHHAFRDEMQLSGVNSINWGRIMAQIVYYFTSAASLGAPDREISFTVPTGNFGDIFAGYVAQKMGLPIKQLIIATNQNDILARTLETSRYEVTATSPTISPSMDIQVSSNFERLLFEATDRDSMTIRNQMAGLAQSGSFQIEEKAISKIRNLFVADRCNEDDTKVQIRDSLAKCQYLADPHTAVGLNVAERSLGTNGAMITLATAHPAKFPKAVKEATGIHPDLPEKMGDMMQREERYEILPNSTADLQQFIRSKSRLASD